MIQPDATIKERDVSRIRSVGRLQQVRHRLSPLSLFLRWHSFEIVGQNSGRSQSLHRSKITNGGGYLVMRAVTDDDDVFRELQTIDPESDPKSLRTLKKLTGFISFQPYLPGMDRTLSRKSPMRASPKGTQPGFNDGRDALHQVRVLRPILIRVLILEGLDLLPEIAHASRRRENGGSGRSRLILRVGRNLKQTETAGIQAFRHEGFVRPGLDLEVDTGSVLRGRIAKCVDCPQKRLRMCAAVRDVTRSICLTADFRLKCDCPSEAVYDQMRTISFHSAMFQVPATNACASLRR